MKRSVDRVLTTHVGSLPRPSQLLELLNAREAGTPIDPVRYEDALRTAVAEAARKQAENGLDVINDGEMGKAGFIHYVNRRLSGFEPGNSDCRAGSYYARSRDGEAFPEYYEWQATMPSAAGKASNMEHTRWICTGPIEYRGYKELWRDLENLKVATEGLPSEDRFVTAIGPGNLEEWNRNEYYKSDEEYLYAIAEALREEYRAIVDAGFLLQVDDPILATYYVMHPEASVEDCRRWAQIRVEALNHALRGIPEDRVRYHTCYSINIGPRVHDLELKHIADIMLRIRAGAYSFEAGNVRHEHEWRVWQTTNLTAGKVLIPGVITHASNLVEHPELIAERIIRFANVVGRENVIAGADCGFSSFATYCEIHPTVVWAKFNALRDGARLASKELWKR